MKKEIKQETKKELKKVGMNVLLTIEENEKGFKNIFITTYNNTRVWLVMGKFNSKLLYKLICECEEKEKKQ